VRPAGRATPVSWFQATTSSTRAPRHWHEEPAGEPRRPRSRRGAEGATARIFINFPKWGDDVHFTLAELRDGKPIAYPNEVFNPSDPDDPAAALALVQSVVVDPADRLWLLDTGSPMFQPTEVGGPKLVCVDLATDRVVRRIVLPYISV
jgi:hypothetical protein